MTIPEWLAKREGALRPGLSDSIFLVVLNGHPQYKISAVPAAGKFSCAITQTNNGKRLDSGKTYPSKDEALKGALEELRTKLGW
jgi:hypothetical protein